MLQKLLRKTRLIKFAVTTSTIQTRIDRARIIFNFDFWWNCYSKFLGYPASCCHLYYSTARSIQELVYIKSIRYFVYILMPRFVVMKINYFKEEIDYQKEEFSTYYRYCHLGRLGQALAASSYLPDLVVGLDQAFEPR